MRALSDRTLQFSLSATDESVREASVGFKLLAGATLFCSVIPRPEAEKHYALRRSLLCKLHLMVNRHLWLSPGLFGHNSSTSYSMIQFCVTTLTVALPSSSL